MVMLCGWVDGEEGGWEERREVRELVVRAREAKMEMEGWEGRTSVSVRSEGFSVDDMSGD